MKTNGMTDMARSSSELKEESKPSKYVPSKYSYGTTIRLNKAEMAKLGIEELPELDDTFAVICIAKCTSASQHASKSGQDTNMELQITHMTLKKQGKGDAADEAKETKKQEQGEQLNTRSKPGAVTMR